MEKHERAEELKGEQLSKTWDKIDALAKYSYASTLSQEVKEALLCYNSKKRFTKNNYKFVEDYSDLLEGSWKKNREIFISRFANYINGKSAEIYRDLKNEGIPPLPSLSSDLTHEQILNERASWLESVDGLLRPMYSDNDQKLLPLEYKELAIAKIIIDHEPIKGPQIAIIYQREYIRNPDDEGDNCHDESVRGIFKRKLSAYGFISDQGYRAPVRKDQLDRIKKKIKYNFSDQSQNKT